ncbi:MAG: hypothetical protein WC082_13865 [Victivallales bacterium]
MKNRETSAGPVSGAPSITRNKKERKGKMADPKIIESVVIEALQDQAFVEVTPARQNR